MMQFCTEPSISIVLTIQSRELIISASKDRIFISADQFHNEIINSYNL